MAYSQYHSLKKVEKALNLKLMSQVFFEYESIEPIEPSIWLIESLRRAHKLKFESEKERSERIVSPILSELANINDGKLTIYSGHNLDIDKEKGLMGECDYLMSLGDKVIDVVQSPLFTIVEAKRQDMTWGTAQCAAQMVGAKQYNEADGVQLPYIYGATTDGIKWRFLKLVNNDLFIDTNYYTIDNLPKLLGVLQFILDDCRKF
jgi:restriction endonuclease S subunit